jgi:hypothetical protein
MSQYLRASLSYFSASAKKQSMEINGGTAQRRGAGWFELAADLSRTA